MDYMTLKEASEKWGVTTRWITGEIVFNEVNTIPGFTTHSRYPNMMKAAGFTFEQIVSALIEQAVRE